MTQIKINKGWDVPFLLLRQRNICGLGDSTLGGLLFLFGFSLPFVEVWKISC